MFYNPLTDLEIARQVANLINQNNRLAGKRRDIDILGSKVKYMVETHGKFVIGAVGVDRVSYSFTEMKHLVVSPAWRRKGVGKHLIRHALRLVDTPMVYCTIREGNDASIRLFESLGFTKANTYVGQNHNVVVLTYAPPTWKNRWANLTYEPDWYSEIASRTPSADSASESWISINELPPLHDL